MYIMVIFLGGCFCHRRCFLPKQSFKLGLREAGSSDRPLDQSVWHLRHNAKTCICTWSCVPLCVSVHHQHWLYFYSPNRNDEMVNILGSYCSRLHHHLKDSMGNLSLSLIHSPLQAAYKHTHSYRSCMLLERVHISICNLYVSVSPCFTCF